MLQTPAVFRFVIPDNELASALTEEEKAVRLSEIETFISQFADLPPINKKKRRTLIEMSAAKFSSYKLGVIIAHCCRYMDLSRAYQTYIEAKETEVALHNDVYSMLISLVAGLGDQGSSLAPPRAVEPPSDAAAARVIFTDMRQKLVPMSESMYTAMIRCYSTSGAVNEAVELYKEMTRPFAEDELARLLEVQGFDELPEKFKRPFLPKLRTYCPLLASCSAAGDADMCLWLYGEMTERFKITPMERDYVSMMKVFIQKRDNDNFHTVLRAFMEDFLVPQEATWAVLREWFETCEAGAGSEEYIAAVCEASRAGCLQANKHFLQSVDLDENTREVLLRQIDSIASEQHDTIVNASAQTGVDTAAEATSIVLGGGKGKMTPKMLERTKQNAHETQAKWAAFKAWLANIIETRVDTFQTLPMHDGGKANRHLAQRPRYSYQYDVIIDGANIGFYKQNYIGAPKHVDYLQIDWMLRHLQRIGYKPLVMLHCRHLMPGSVPQEYLPLITSWRDHRLIYETPAKCNDDWFWLYLAVKLQCKVVTNDEMRDHHFQMLSPRNFARWKERHQIHFSFGEWCKIGDQTEDAQSARDDSSGEEEVATPRPVATHGITSAYLDGRMAAGGHWRRAQLEVPRCYSHRMQCLISDASFAFPCEDNNKWLCCYRKRTIGTASDTALAESTGTGVKRKWREVPGAQDPEERLLGLSALEQDDADHAGPPLLKRQLTKPLYCANPADAAADTADTADTLDRPVLQRQITKPLDAADAIGSLQPPPMKRQLTEF